MGQRNSKKQIKQADLDYLLQHTSFTKKQVQKWYKSFVKDCPEGQLTRKTFLEMYTQFFPDDKAQKFYEHLFRTFDSDNSGNIDFREFLVAIHTTQNGKPDEKLKLAFKLYDIDSNGHIERHEMAEIIKAIFLMVGSNATQEAATERTAAIFGKMDINNDGVLTQDEFVSGCMNDESLFKLLACSDKA